MGAWITLIASFVIGGLVLLSFGRLTNDVSRDLYIDTIDHATYGDLDEVVRIIEYDFSRIGLGINDPKQSVLIQADSTNLRYFLDSDGNGILETMRYYLSDTTAAAMTENPRDKILYRVDNGGAPEVITTGLTDFRIKYYDSSGNESSDFQQIRTFVVGLTMESGMVYDNQSPRLMWQGGITPPNLVTH